MKTINPVSILMLVTCISFIFLINVHAQSTTVLSSYLNIKDALVKTNPKTAGVAAGELVSLLNGKTDELSKKMLVDAKVISENSDVKMQRSHFDQLSQNVYTYVKKSGQKSGTIYKQYCPMANAIWLAGEKEINNPYFGDKMLHCGCVKEEL